VVIVSEEQYMMLNRSLLYTAVTRAKKQCELFVAGSDISEAIATQQQRLTGLKRRLAQLVNS